MALFIIAVIRSDEINPLQANLFFAYKLSKENMKLTLIIIR